VLLVGHSMGGLVSIEYVGAAERPPVDAFIAASCTAIPRGVALQTYRTLARGFDRLPGRGAPIAEWVLDRTLPVETRADFGAGGYAYDAQDTALRSLSVLDLLAALSHRGADVVRERAVRSVAHQREAVHVSGARRGAHRGATYLAPGHRDASAVFNAVVDLALATMDAGTQPAPSGP
jgi:pimeloyl-ACP methyl ester carboxylesterase